MQLVILQGYFERIIKPLIGSSRKSLRFSSHLCPRLPKSSRHWKWMSAIRIPKTEYFKYLSITKEWQNLTVLMFLTSWLQRYYKKFIIKWKPLLYNIFNMQLVLLFLLTQWHAVQSKWPHAHYVHVCCIL